MIYDILHNLEKHIPQNIAKTRTNVLLPIYRFVTSANFIIGIIVVVMILTILLSQGAFAYEQEVIDRNGIKNVVVTDLNHNTTSVIFEYCFNKYILNSVGVLVASDLDAVPVPIGSDYIKYGKCVIYGTTILAESDIVRVTLFEQNSIDALVSSLNIKVHDLKNTLAQTEQKIRQYTKLDSDNDKIHQLKQQADLLEKQIKSAQSGVKTLIAMKNS